MKVTVVPAQVTTVEDRIAGSLGLSQIMLLAAPVFGGSALYVIMPPLMKSALYKYIVIGLLAAICGLLAIRIKGKLLIYWLIVLLRYNLRPHFYVFDKRSLHGRESSKPHFIADQEDEPVIITERVRRELALSPAEVMALEDIIDDPAANLIFQTDKRGRLYARITEIQ